MARRTTGPGEGFHEGEVSVQQQAGVRAEADHLVRMLDPVELVGGIVGFLAQRTFIVMSARDTDGMLWTSPLTGPEGFLQVAGPQDLHIAATPAPGDPLHGLPADQEVGLVTIELGKRRRFRLNGHLAVTEQRGLSVEVQQAYGNCPQYIQQRLLSPLSASTEPEQEDATSQLDRRSHLSVEDIAQVQSADTFFLGTTHPTRGNDASHRGGPAGFVRVDGDQSLWWPDYQGNNMFNSLGNLAVDATAALLFIDFSSGRSLHLTGRAFVETTTPSAPGDDGGTGRRVRFQLDTATAGARLPLRATHTIGYPRNPPISS